MNHYDNMETMNYNMPNNYLASMPVQNRPSSSHTKQSNNE